MRPNLLRVAVALIGAAAAIAPAGCWYPALQFAPLALQGAQMAGSGVLALAEQATGAVQRSGHDNLCQGIPTDSLVVIELRQGVMGAPDYRELHVEGSGDEARWTPIIDDDTEADGWRPAVNFLQMNFSPPLGNVVPKTGTAYLAYGPVELESSSDQERLVAFGKSSGTPVGTFEWNDRVYSYAMIPTLPCFPPPTSTDNQEF